MTTGASSSPAMDPVVFPAPKVDTARLRSASGTHVATIRSPAAGAKPSPMPTKTRLAMKTSVETVAALGASMVARDQSPTAKSSTRLPPHWEGSSNFYLFLPYQSRSWANWNGERCWAPGQSGWPAIHRQFASQHSPRKWSSEWFPALSCPKRSPLPLEELQPTCSLCPSARLHTWESKLQHSPSILKSSLLSILLFESCTFYKLKPTCTEQLSPAYKPQPSLFCHFIDSIKHLQVFPSPSHATLRRPRGQSTDVHLAALVELQSCPSYPPWEQWELLQPRQHEPQKTAVAGWSKAFFTEVCRQGEGFSQRNLRVNYVTMYFV